MSSDPHGDATASFLRPVVPREEHESLSVLATCVRNLPIDATYSYELKGLASDEQVLEVLSALERRHSHALSTSARAAIVRKRLSRNPLYVSLVYQRLIMLHRPDFERIYEEGGSIDAIARYEEKTVEECPDDLRNMVDDLYESADKRINPELTEYVIDTIASTRFGAKVGELAAIDPEVWSAIDFSHLVNYLSDSFILREDGRYDFAHRIIREEYAKAPGLLWHVQSRIVSYLSGLPEDDPTRVSEIAHHLMMSDHHTDFCNYIKRWQPDKNRRLNVVLNTYRLRAHRYVQGRRVACLHSWQTKGVHYAVKE